MILTTGGRYELARREKVKVKVKARK